MQSLFVFTSENARQGHGAGIAREQSPSDEAGICPVFPKIRAGWACNRRRVYLSMPPGSRTRYL